MNLDLPGIISRAFEISWRHKWLWLLGIFGGGGGVAATSAFPTGGTGRGSGSVALTYAQLEAFFTQYGWVLLLMGAGVLIVAVSTFLFACVAVPGTIWAALQLDAGQEVRLGQAWRQGLRRFGAVFRLNLIRLAAGLVLATPLAISAPLLLASLRGSAGALAGLILLMLLCLALLVIGGMLLGLATVWAERLIILRAVGAVEAIRQSWWLMRQSLLDTIVFAVVMGVLAGVVGVGVSLLALVVTMPGIVAAWIGFSSSGALFTVGMAWIILLGLGALLVGGGFAGSLVQVAYAIACRDLCRRHGLEIDGALASAQNPPAAVQPAPAS